jgi:glycosyltransferase involved in cell wall biosynthesis
VAKQKNMTSHRLLFLVTEDWYFLSYRLDLARSARNAGYQVVVATRVGGHGDQITSEGFRLEPLDWKRGSLNPVELVRSLFTILRLYRRVRPDIVHHVSLKPIVLGSMVALLMPNLPVVNSLTGFGHTFTARTLWARVLARAVSIVLVPLLRRRATITIVENEDDRRFLVETLHVPIEQTANLGAGVDLRRFTPMPLPNRTPVTIGCVARMLVIKGVGDLAAASRMLGARGVPHHLILAGGTDPENPGSIAEATIKDWVQEGIECPGQVADPRDVWRRVDIAVQPSLGGEGLPRSLVEAAACGRPLVVTDVPGCRDVARADVNGFIVPPAAPAALADALERLVRDQGLRERFAAESRRIVEAAFSLDQVLAATLALYDRLLTRSR